MTNPSVEDGEARIAEIRARLAAATPGPWSWQDWTAPSNVADASPIEKRNSLVAPPESRPRGASMWFPDLGQRVLSSEEDPPTEDDKLLIANAPDDLTFLLSVVESQAKDIESLKTLYGGAAHEFARLGGEPSETGSEPHYGKDCPVGMVQVEFVGAHAERNGKYGWKPGPSAFLEIYVDGQRFRIDVGTFTDGTERRGLHIVTDKLNLQAEKTSLNAASLFFADAPAQSLRGEDATADGTARASLAERLRKHDIAGALIAAEIDRLQRQAAGARGSESTPVGEDA